MRLASVIVSAPKNRREADARTHRRRALEPFS
jgi:hypothetical protein